MKTTNDRLLESIINETNNFSDTNLDRTILLEISKKLVDYVVEVDSSHSQEGSVAKSLENDLYNKIK
ncbi:hypothetical protein [Salegentibacter maritimus]|uniref:hypothetical protein n=1 Tax=Salegentibacter maritimus TaxID=2794347 RepID=UPI0018E4C77A|nr:hypothetical protein [Salegentibacter maritimus]MBI6115990.1 hypothetical protein [Salegentibacter maritimus]